MQRTSGRGDGPDEHGCSWAAPAWPRDSQSACRQLPDGRANGARQPEPHPVATVASRAVARPYVHRDAAAAELHLDCHIVGIEGVEAERAYVVPGDLPVAKKRNARGEGSKSYAKGSILVIDVVASNLNAVPA